MAIIQRLGCWIFFLLIACNVEATQSKIQTLQGYVSSVNSLKGLPEVTFLAINTNETLKTRLYDDQGQIPQALRIKLNRFLRDHRTKRIYPIDSRLLKLVYKCAYHFKAKKVVVISAYRAGNQGFHSKGMACDFRIPGVSSRRLAAYARTLGKVGVGYYPSVDYIHLDVRAASYFWVNYSGKFSYGPDQPIKRDWANPIDYQWRPTNDLPWAKVTPKILSLSLRL